MRSTLKINVRKIVTIKHIFLRLSCKFLYSPPCRFHISPSPSERGFPSLRGRRREEKAFFYAISVALPKARGSATRLQWYSQTGIVWLEEKENSLILAEKSEPLDLPLEVLCHLSSARLRVTSSSSSRASLHVITARFHENYSRAQGDFTPPMIHSKLSSVPVSWLMLMHLKCFRSLRTWEAMQNSRFWYKFHIFP